MKHFKILIILFFISIVFGQFPAEYKKEMKIGLNYYTNFEFDSAEKVYSQITEKYPNDPLGWFYLMNTKYESLKFNGKFKNADIFLLNEIQRISPLFENKIDGYPDEVVYLVYYGTLKGMSARINLAESNYMKAFSESWRAINLIEKAYEINPKYWDVFLPLGSYNFYGGVMADHYSVVDLIYNSEKKRKLGIEQLTIAYENGVGAKWEAGRILLLIYLHETKEYEKANKIGKKLVTQFPNNLEFKSLYIELLVYLDKINEAEKLLKNYSKSYVNISQKGKKVWKVREKYLNAALNMQKGNYKDAKESFLFVIENYNLEFQWFKVLSYLKIGQIYDIQKQRENAKKYYQLAIDTKETTQAVKEAKEYLINSFTIRK